MSSGESRISIEIDGHQVSVPAGTTVAVALLHAGAAEFRRSATGSPRGPICAMGVCFECRVTVDEQPHRRACMTICEPDMKVVTGG